MSRTLYIIREIVTVIAALIMGVFVLKHSVTANNDYFDNCKTNYASSEQVVVNNRAMADMWWAWNTAVKESTKGIK